MFVCTLVVRGRANRAKRREAAEVARWVRHVSTPLEGDFQQLFMAALAFPHSTDPFPHLAAARGASDGMHRRGAEDAEDN